jgi:hypothetical protein
MIIVKTVLEKTDWHMLRDQKLALLRLLNAEILDESVASHLNGLLNWIDSLQDAAEHEGYPVIFMSENVDQLDI